jgi:hypothetical protein
MAYWRATYQRAWLTVTTTTSCIWCSKAKSDLWLLQLHHSIRLPRHVEKDPGTFEIGDIVEMGFALVAWKKQGKNTGLNWSCMLVLRTLTFLDGQFTKVSVVWHR